MRTTRHRERCNDQELKGRQRDVMSVSLKMILEERITLLGSTGYVWVGRHDFPPFYKIQMIQLLQREQGRVPEILRWRFLRGGSRWFETLGLNGEGGEARGIPEDASLLTLALARETEDALGHTFIAGGDLFKLYVEHLGLTGGMNAEGRRAWDAAMLAPQQCFFGVSGALDPGMQEALDAVDVLSDEWLEMMNDTYRVVLWFE